MLGTTAVTTGPELAVMPEASIGGVEKKKKRRWMDMFFVLRIRLRIATHFDGMTCSLKCSSGNLCGRDNVS